ncbi:hypothetical protein Dimus_006023 [Dionaea muscipula]
MNDEEVMDAFWDILPRVDGAAGFTVTGLSPDVIQEEVVQEKESVQAQTPETSSILPTNAQNQPPELLKETTPSEDKGKALVETLDARIVVAYEWVDEGLYLRDHDILLVADPRRLRGAMMVNALEVIT